MQSAQQKNKNHMKDKETYICSNSDIYADIVSLAYILYMRLEVPEHFDKAPAFTSTPQLIDQILVSKKAAMVDMVFPREKLAKTLLNELKALYYQVMDEYELDPNEKHVLWLLSRAYSVKQCAKITSKSVSSIRYTMSRICEKTDCETKEEVLNVLNNKLEGKR